MTESYLLRFGCLPEDKAALPEHLRLRVIENLALDLHTVKRLTETHYLVRKHAQGDYQILPLPELLTYLEQLPIAEPYVPRQGSLQPKQSITDLLSDLGL